MLFIKNIREIAERKIRKPELKKKKKSLRETITEIIAKKKELIFFT
jgi:hypothetical protein